MGGSWLVIGRFPQLPMRNPAVHVVSSGVWYGIPTTWANEVLGRKNTRITGISHKKRVEGCDCRKTSRVGSESFLTSYPTLFYRGPEVTTCTAGFLIGSWGNPKHDAQKYAGASFVANNVRGKYVEMALDYIAAPQNAFGGAQNARALDFTVATSISIPVLDLELHQSTGFLQSPSQSAPRPCALFYSWQSCIAVYGCGA